MYRCKQLTLLPNHVASQMVGIVALIAHQPAARQQHAKRLTLLTTLSSPLARGQAVCCRRRAS